MRDLLRYAITLLLLHLTVLLLAQPFRNEWIDYNKTYHKFKLTHFTTPAGMANTHTSLTDYSGFYRIPYSTLQSAGLHNTPVEHLQLWRDGKEVTIYTVPSTGIMGTDGYIEFWSDGNNGKLENEMYKNVNSQHNQRWSLFSDSASFYLTVNTTLPNKRYTTVSNLPSASTLEELPYFMHKLRINYRTGRHLGRALVAAGQEVRASTFDDGEGYAMRTNGTQATNLSAIQMYTGPLPINPLRISFAVAGAADINRNVNIAFNNKNVASFSLSRYNNLIRAPQPISDTFIVNDNANIQISKTSGGEDVIAVSFIQLEYPRKPDLNNNTAIKFELPATATGYKLRWKRVNAGGAAQIILLDITNGKRYLSEKVGDDYLFLVEPSNQPMELFLSPSAAEGLHYKNILNSTAKNFTNFSAPGQQGDYLIISNARLFNQSGSNPVNMYKNYRSSALGGNYNAQIFDVDELYEQFAYGIKFHPIAIRNFGRFANQVFSPKPKFVFLIGRGVIYSTFSDGNPLADQLNLVPTWGHPASDNALLASNNLKPSAIIPVGRLAAINTDEVASYLAKVVEFESYQAGNNDKSWQKNVLHLVGGNDPGIVNKLTEYMDNLSKVIKDTLLGANLETVIRILDPNTAGNVQKFKDKFNEGVSLVNYFGHSSSTSLDFNLNDPGEIDIPPGKFPVFLANGCNASEFFTLSLQRLTDPALTLGERFIINQQAGAIAFISSTHFGEVTNLNNILRHWYHFATGPLFGQPIGLIHKRALDSLLRINMTGNPTELARLSGEQYHLHGDPAIRMHTLSKPDYSVVQEDIFLSPGEITTATDSVYVTFTIRNLGITANDSFNAKVIYTPPSGQAVTLTTFKSPPVPSNSSSAFKIPLKGIKSAGNHYFSIELDPEDLVDELSNDNNVTVKYFEVSSTPVMLINPVNYAIVNNASAKLTFSAVNPFNDSIVYRVEIDTSNLFNSSSKILLSKKSSGSLIDVPLPGGLTNERVYYWRVSPELNNMTSNWQDASFTWIPASSEGVNQGHYFQHLQSDFDNLKLPPTERRFRFDSTINNLYISHGIFPTSGTEDSHFSITTNGVLNIASACVGKSIIFNVFDSASFVPWENTDSRFGSAGFCAETRRYNFEFPYFPRSNRKKILDFLDSIPRGMYVAARLVVDPPFDSINVNIWKTDTVEFGPGKSLYHAFIKQGFSGINQLTSARTFGIVFKKDDTLSFVPQFKLSESIYDRVFLSVDITQPDTIATLTSPLFGPAKTWNTVSLSTNPALLNAQPTDSSFLHITGFDNHGRDSILSILPFHTPTNIPINHINAAEFPFLKLSMVTRNPVIPQPAQLNYWRIHYIPAPEGAIASNEYYKVGEITIPSQGVSETLVQGNDSLVFGIAFKNISNQPFAEPIKVQVQIQNEAGSIINDTLITTHPLPAGETLQFDYKFKTGGLDTGNHYLYVNFNPKGNQPEINYENNYIYQPFSMVLPAIPTTPKTFVGTGNWSQPERWIPAGVPLCSNEVFIEGDCTVDFNSAMASTLTIKETGKLRFNTLFANLNIGCGMLGGNRLMVVRGLLEIQNGQCWINGGLYFAQNSQFVQSGGQITLDPNTGISANSLPTAFEETDSLPPATLSFGGMHPNESHTFGSFGDGTATITGGSIIFKDPSWAGKGYSLFARLNNNYTLRFGGTHNMRFGQVDGFANHTGHSAGFGVQLYGAGTPIGNLVVQSIIIDGGNNAGRKWFMDNLPPFTLWVPGGVHATSASIAEIKEKGSLMIMPKND